MPLVEATLVVYLQWLTVIYMICFWQAWTLSEVGAELGTNVPVAPDQAPAHGKMP